MARVFVAMGGRHYAHPLDFTINRPYGMPEWLFVCFREAVDVRDGTGPVRGAAGSCILFEPGFPQWYRGHEVGLDNDWLHLDGPGMPDLVARYSVPRNRLFQPRDVAFVGGLIEAMLVERQRESPFWEDAVALLVEELFLRLSRACQAKSPSGLTPTEAEHFHLFGSIRAAVQQRLKEPWDVPAMARRAHLSVPRFAVLYKRFFGVSPMEDLIQARLDYACHLLTNTTMSVGEAASASGFDNVCHFSRLFRRRIGCAPRQYQRHGAAVPEGIARH